MDFQFIHEADLKEFAEKYSDAYHFLLGRINQNEFDYLLKKTIRTEWETKRFEELKINRLDKI
jgi:hypothetical protein